ncbi:Transmembrane protein [Melia azedarach]|uniref:Transmembrane protein n=1 Tax=Melia azedarach TaxID=155640 RepID=A0ACC1YN80_MELAZ|nr:Transmembrane protein [Melia azedarach]
MEIQEKLLKFKFHIIFALIFFAVLTSLIILAPRFLTILAYFWPLFLSTALFLVAVVFFGKTSVPVSDSSSSGEGLLDYVAGNHLHHHHQPAEVAVESSKSE